ncbi:MAG: hypothetical protein LBV16_02870 [Elusimicrobiota bacterium]|jgi:spore photoproduct lyase|nr:hypothetical protein [Elusimicrobiota bacterium]
MTDNNGAALKNHSRRHCGIDDMGQNKFLESSYFDLSFNAVFPKFGTNKSREIKRLIFEISKIEKCEPSLILNSIKDKNYASVKKILLQKRYPKNFSKIKSNSYYLPKYEIDENLKADLNNSPFDPKNIYFENGAQNSILFDNVKKKFPKAFFKEIPSLKIFSKEKPFSIADYNKRNSNLFIVKEKYDFFKRCPCTSGAANCGYSIMNLGMGCPYECSYCFLQGYQNIAGIVLPYNIGDYLLDEKISGAVKGLFDYKRIGSGEWTDSLVFDDITQFSKPIIEFFRNKPDIFFEFKTKSANVSNILSIDPAKNIAIAWSVNAPEISKNNEFKSAALEQRLESAKQCAKAGFKTAFHFDPIIYYKNWKDGYKQTIDMIFDAVPNDSILWISFGTLRMPAILKPIIENRFPKNEILNAELLLGQDYKLRYDEETKREIYTFMNKQIKSKKSKAIVYLCMENV